MISSGHTNFLDLPPEQSDIASARYAVLPVPFEETVSYRFGTADGPEAILAASSQVELLDEEFLAEYVACGIATLEALTPQPTVDGDWPRLYPAAREVMAAGKFLLALGGEHSISAPLVRAAREVHGPVSVLQIDAHADLRRAYEGKVNSHASVMRRVIELGCDITQVGIRNVCTEELTDCPEQVARFFTPRRIAAETDWIDQVLAQLGDRVYVTVDIDGFDPGEAPGTGTPEPGGLSWFTVTDLLRRVCAEREVVSADIVEVRPLGENHITEFLAARLGYKLITYTQR